MRRLVSLVALFVVAATACSKSDSASRATTFDGVPVRVGATRGPGEAIADGFVVPAGARLLGAPFPPVHSEQDQSGWNAYFIVTGTPQSVIADIRRQADAHGITTIPRENFGTCLSSYDAVTRCAVEGWTSDPGRSRGVEIRFARRSDPPMSLLHLRYHDPQRVTGEPTWQPWPNPDVPGSTAIPLPATWKPLAGIGQPVFADDPEFPNDIHVAAGSELISAPSAASSDASGIDRVAIMLVRGNVDDVVGRYARQFAQASLDADPRLDHPIEHYRYRGWSVVEAHYGSPGDGGNGIVQAVTVDGDTFLRLVYSPTPASRRNTSPTR